MLTFQKATRKLAKLRLAIFGPSGAGKTMTALRMAHGVTSWAGDMPQGKIAVIDTERGSASKYADHPKFKFDFDTLLLEDKTLRGYLEAIRAAAAAGYDVLIIDSLTHGWRELLHEVEKLARNKYGGNTWAAWNEGTPKQQAFIEALLNYPGHIIATMRSKTEWTTRKSDNGKVEPVRIGLAPEEGKGIEYEFDLLLEMDTEHSGRVIKDRTSKYQDSILELPGEEFGRDLMAWLSSGAAPDKDDFLKFLLPILTGMGVMSESSKPYHVKMLLNMSPFAGDYGPDRLDDIRVWAMLFNKHHREQHLTPDQAAVAATGEWATLPKEVPSA